MSHLARGVHIGPFPQKKSDHVNTAVDGRDM